MEKENSRNEENKELDEEFLTDEEFDDEEFDDEEFDDEDDIGFIGTESDLDVCTEDSIINDCVDEVLKNGSVSVEKEKTEQDAGTDLLTAPETEDVNKEEPNEEHDKPVSKKKPSLFQKWFHKSDVNNTSDVPVISGIDMEKADIVVSKKSREKTKENSGFNEPCETEPLKEIEEENTSSDEPFHLSDDEILGKDTAASLPENASSTEEKKKGKESKQAHTKSLRTIVLVSIASVVSVLVILLIIFFLLKGDGPVSRIAKEHSLVSDVAMKDISVDEDLKSFIHSGMYYNIQNGYTHALGEEELEAVRKVFDGSNIIGSQISYEDYTAILESISSNSLDDLAFLILHEKDQNESIIILKAGEDLYFENESVPDTVWYLDKENENTVSLSNLMMMLSKLQDLEKQLNP